MINAIDFDALRGIGLGHAVVAQAMALTAQPGDQLMRVMAVQRELLTLHDGLNPCQARPWPTWGKHRAPARAPRQPADMPRWHDSRLTLT